VRILGGIGIPSLERKQDKYSSAQKTVATAQITLK
jgi:hypothetical protein